jgi:hypothetical protein
MTTSRLARLPFVVALLLPPAGSRAADSAPLADRDEDRFDDVKGGVYVLQHMEWEGAKVEKSTSIWQFVYVERGRSSWTAYGSNGETLNASNIKDNKDKCAFTIRLYANDRSKDKRAFIGVVTTPVKDADTNEPGRLLIAGLVEERDGVMRVCLEAQPAANGEPRPRFKRLEKGMAKESVENLRFPDSPAMFRAEKGDGRMIYVFERAR